MMKTQLRIKTRSAIWTNYWHLLPKILVYKPENYSYNITQLLAIEIGWLCFSFGINIYKQ